MGQRCADASRQRDTTLEGGRPHRYERTHVERSEAGMGAVMPTHVEPRGHAVREGDRRVADRFRRPDDGEDGAVRIGAAVHVQQPHAVHPRHGGSEGCDHVRIAALGHIRYAGDERLFRHAGA